MKKIFLVTVLLLFLSGCIPHYELNERAIVEAVGIDYKDKKYTVTMQYYSVSGSGGESAIDNSKPNVLTLKGEGESIYTALSDASFKNGKSLMLGENQLIILGKDTLENNLNDLLSFAVTYYQCHPKVKVTIAKDKAEDILKVKFKEGVESTEKLNLMLENAKQTGFSPATSLYEILIGMRTKLSGAYIPVLEKVNDKTDTSEGGDNIKISGGVVFKHEKPAGELSEEEVKGLEFLKNNITGASVTVNFNDKPFGVGLYDVKTIITPKFKNGELNFYVKFTSNAKYLENKLPSLNNNFKNAKEIGTQAEQKLTFYMKKATDKIVNEYGADILWLENLVRQREYSEFMKNEQRFEELLKSSKWHISSKINIEKYGLEQ